MFIITTFETLYVFTDVFNQFNASWLRKSILFNPSNFCIILPISGLQTKLPPKKPKQEQSQ